jgi:hypothetical protein
MIFTISRSDDPDDAHAPFLVLKDGQPVIDGLEFESEAQAVVDLLNQPPPKVVQISARPRWLAGGRGGRHPEIAP